MSVDPPAEPSAARSEYAEEPQVTELLDGYGIKRNAARACLVRFVARNAYKYYYSKGNPGREQTAEPSRVVFTRQMITQRMELQFVLDLLSGKGTRHEVVVGSWHSFIKTKLVPRYGQGFISPKTYSDLCNLAVKFRLEKFNDWDAVDWSTGKPLRDFTTEGRALVEAERNYDVDIAFMRDYVAAVGPRIIIRGGDQTLAEIITGDVHCDKKITMRGVFDLIREGTVCVRSLPGPVPFESVAASPVDFKRVFGPRHMYQILMRLSWGWDLDCHWASVEEHSLKRKAQ